MAKICHSTSQDQAKGEFLQLITSFSSGFDLKFVHLFTQYILGTTFTNQNHEDQFISITKLLKYDETRRKQEQEIIVNGDSVAEIDVCENSKFLITPRNVRNYFIVRTVFC